MHRRHYLILTLILFVIEVLIGMYVKDSIIRPFGGDVLVVMLIYCFVKTFLNIQPYLLATCVLIFAFLIEILQYYHFADILHLKNKILRTIVGTSFSWYDMLSYFIGYLLILFFESKLISNNKKW